MTHHVLALARGNLANHLQHNSLHNILDCETRLFIVRMTGFILIYAGLTMLNNTSHAQWTRQPSPTTEYLWRVGFIDASTGWILGTNQVYKTTNGGISWQTQDSLYGAGFAFTALDQNIVFYAKLTGINSRGIRRTTDGGTSWQTVDSDTSFYCTDITFTSAQVGYAVGGTFPMPFVPALRKTTDGGGTWFTLPNAFPQARDEFEAISFINTLRGWVVSYDGVVFRTTDGGSTWEYQDSVGYRVPGIGWLPTRDVQFISKDVGWVGGGISWRNFVAKTTNGGATWSYAPAGGTSIRRIVMLTSLVGWIVGTTGNPICKTTDGGASWSSQQLIPQTGDGFEWISMIDQQNGWAVGISGRVFKTTNGGVVFTEEGKVFPPSFQLSQNYPNPFNPVTHIGFRIADFGFVFLKVYDVLGREVATLVNEVKTPGKHEVKFDGTSLPSGVYFYKLQSVSGSIAKRMILIK